MTAPIKTSVLIVGGGPAGLAAALMCSRHMVPTIIFSNEKFRNDPAKEMHTVPTWDGVKPAEYRNAARKELQKRYNTNTFVNKAVRSLQQGSAGSFYATVEDGTTYVGKKVVLATGVRDILPSLKGYEECWAKGIYHCLFCHGYEDRGAEHAGLLAIDMMANAQFCLPVACMIKNLAKSVTLYTNGDEQLAQQIKQDAEKHGLKVESRKIARLELQSLDGPNINVHFAHENDKGCAQDSCGFLAHTPRPEFRKPWAKDEDGLSLEYTEMGTVKVFGPMNETSIHGVFAAGDSSPPMKNFNGSAASGGMAGAGVVHQLSMETSSSL